MKTAIPLIFSLLRHTCPVFDIFLVIGPQDLFQWMHYARPGDIFLVPLELFCSQEHFEYSVGKINEALISVV